MNHESFVSHQSEDLYKHKLSIITQENHLKSTLTTNNHFRFLDIQVLFKSLHFPAVIILKFSIHIFAFLKQYAVLNIFEKSVNGSVLSWIYSWQKDLDKKRWISQGYTMNQWQN